jgi:hypothetical protein
MKAMNNTVSKIQSVTAALLVAASLPVLGAADARQAAPLRVETVNETQTSWIPRVITNVIELRIPTNIFVNVYRTNQIEVVRSNIINVYRTNWIDRTETRIVPVDLTRTNFVTRYQTNLNTLTFTNWETVLVMKTNRVTQRVPNVVEIDLPAVQSSAPQTGGTPVSTAIAASAEGLSLDTVTTGKVTIDDLVEVRFRLKAAKGATPVLASYEWRVERTDGSVLLFGQEPEFKREVPMGTYRIEVKARAAASSPLVRVKGVVEVTDAEVIQQPVLGASAR